MSFLRKIKPYKVDLLLYGIQKGEGPLEYSGKKLSFPLNFESDISSYVIRQKSVLIHKSKIFKSSRLLKSFGFSNPFITIGDCLTDEAYKGQGIYPAVLSHIIKDHSAEKAIFMLVSPDNIPSIRGIEKAGFKKIARLECLKIGPFYFNKKIEG